MIKAVEINTREIILMMLEGVLAIERPENQNLNEIYNKMPEALKKRLEVTAQDIATYCFEQLEKSRTMQ